MAAAAKALPDAGLVSFGESTQVVTSIIDAGESGGRGGLVLPGKAG